MNSKRPSVGKRLRRWARHLQRETVALYIAYRDPRVSWYARLFAMAVVAYALSPIDLIPDPIPLIGYLDDLLLVPAGIWLALRLIPPGVMADARAEAATLLARGELPVSRTAGAVIITLWVIFFAAVVYWLWWALQT
ncbi:MAG: YkvA family protein [Anaerolineae bacterium]|nr:YkvA family protein [Anaerolineae bacterium]